MLSISVPSVGSKLKLIAVSTYTIIVQSSSRYEDQNGEIDRYAILVNPGNKTYEYDINMVEIRDLLPNTLYTLQGKYATKKGYGPFGEKLTVRTGVAVPCPPLDVHLLEGKDVTSPKRDWHVVWTEPQCRNGNITSYRVDIELKNGTVVDFLIPSDRTHYHVVNTDKFLVKKINVVAQTSAGWGAESKPYYPTEVRIDPKTRDLNQVILVVAVAFAVIFLLILIVLCVLLNRR